MSHVLSYISIDKIVIFETNIEIINDVKYFLPSNFDIKDLRPTDIILTIKLIRSS